MLLNQFRKTKWRSDAWTSEFQIAERENTGNARGRRERMRTFDKPPAL